MLTGLRYKDGSLVRVNLFDGRSVLATVCPKGIEDRVDGRKVRVKHGQVVNLVDDSQIVDVVRR